MQIGVDIVEVGRVQSVLDRWGERFLNRIYTFNEQQEKASLTKPISYLAGRWAAKEAIMKALGVSCSWTDLEITKGNNGQPIVTLLNKASKLTHRENKKISISISHSKEYAVATVII